MIISKTVKTLTAQFEKGLKSKVTYKTKDSNFSPFDFS